MDVLENNQVADAGSVDISLVIPNYNEEGLLETCLTEVRKVLVASGMSYEIIFVDDGSADGSVKILRSLTAASKDVIFVELKRNFGQQKAILAGLRVSRGKIVIPYDPDLQFAPECIPVLAKKIRDEGFDIAGGIRSVRRDAFQTRMFSWFGSFMIDRALGRKVHDFGAVKAYTRQMIDDILKLPADYLIIPAAGLAMTRNVIEIPIKHQARMVGHSKWTFLMRLEMCLDVYVTYAKRPFEWLMIGGFLCGLTSAGLALAIAIYRVFVPQFAGTIILLDIILFFTGVNFLALSLVGEFVVRLFRRKFQVEGKITLEDIMVQRIHRGADAGVSLPAPTQTPAVK